MNKTSATVSRSTSIRRTLLTFSLLLVILPALVFMIVGGASSYFSLLQKARDQISSTADLKRREISRWVEEREGDLAILATETTLQQLVRTMKQNPEDSSGYKVAYSDISVRLIGFLRKKVAFVDISILDCGMYGAGRTIVSTNVLREGKTHQSEPYFTAACAGESYLQTVVEDPILNKPTLLIARPIAEPTGEISGVLIGRVNLSDLNLLLRAKAGLGETGETYLISAEREYLVGSQGLENMPVGAIESTGTQAAVNGESGLGQYIDYRGERVFGAYRWLPTVEMGLIVEQSWAETISVALRQVLVMIGVTVVAVVVAMSLALVVTRRIVNPIAELTNVAMEIAGGDLQRTAPVERTDEIGMLAQAFNSMTTQLRESIGNLEQRVAERTQDLEQRSNQLEVAARVSREAAAIRDVHRLLDATVRLVSSSFGFYHVGIFLVDDKREYAVLQAASSEGGRRMLERGHRLKVGEVGIVGYVTGTGEPRIALDVGEDAVFFSNPDLPETHSEMALPLTVRDRVIGALDVQSTEAAAFSNEDIAILQTLADQVALAIENARLFEETQRALAEVRRTQRLYVREEWEGYVRKHEGQQGYMATAEEVRVASDWWTPEMQQALATQDFATFIDNDDAPKAALAMPVKVRGETIGILDVVREDVAATWTDDDRVLVDVIGEQLALALENARLFEQTQDALSLSERLYEASRRIMEAQEPEQIYQTLIDEYARYGVADHVILALAGPEPIFEPEYLEIVIAWSQQEDADVAKVGTRYSTVEFPLLKLLTAPTEPAIIPDLAAESRLDDAARRALVEGLGIHSMINVPLASGGEWFGILIVQTHDEREFAEEELRFYRSLADRAAMAMRTQRLLAATTDRARRERLAREITTKMRGVTDVEKIMQTAALELSRALNVSHAAILLGDAATLSASNDDGD